MRIGAVQMHVTSSLPLNLSKILSFITSPTCTSSILLFPECALTGYTKEAVETQIHLVNDAVVDIGVACRENKRAVIVGTAITNEKGSIENSLVIIDSSGATIGRQSKLQLVPTDSFCVPGTTLHTFTLNSIKCSAIICHDSRHPELVRLPVLAGARLIFYSSWETWHDDGPVPTTEEGRYLRPYESQVVARAVENRVYVVHSNVAGVSDDLSSGSHGGSRIVDPQGDVIVSAGVWGEEVVEADVDIENSTAAYAKECENKGFFLKEWWREGARKVTGLN